MPKNNEMTAKLILTKAEWNLISKADNPQVLHALKTRLVLEMMPKILQLHALEAIDILAIKPDTAPEVGVSLTMRFVTS